MQHRCPHIFSGCLGRWDPNPSDRCSPWLQHWEKFMAMLRTWCLLSQMIVTMPTRNLVILNQGWICPSAPIFCGRVTALSSIHWLPLCTTNKDLYECTNSSFKKFWSRSCTLHIYSGQGKPRAEGVWQHPRSLFFLVSGPVLAISAM